ncbi:MAG TPA: hypothetical protein VHL34_03335 [Rhizomicrobium sp.]|nr:hypothetical protein [Rhizomicrobium sp.]
MLIFQIIAVGLVIFTAALIVMSLRSGEAINPVRDAQPFIVKKAGDARRYWGGVAVEVLWFGFAILWAMGIFGGLG